METRAPAPPRTVPPPEDKFGIIGGPTDLTAFDYDVEHYESDPAPKLDGIPPIRPVIARALSPYLDARRAQLAAVNPDGKRIAILTRLGETTQLHEVHAPLGVRRQLTFGPEPVDQAAILDQAGTALLYRRDVGGRERDQLFQMDLQTGVTVLVSDGVSRHGPFRWSPRGRLAFTSNARNGTDMDLYVLERSTTGTRRVAELEGQWVPLSWSQDAQSLLVREYRAADECRAHVVDVERGSLVPLSPLKKGEATRNAWFTRRPGRAHVLSNRDADFFGVHEVDLTTMTWRLIAREDGHDIEEGVLAGHGQLLAYTVNDGGYSRLVLFDLNRGLKRPMKTPTGVISGIRFLDRDRKLGFTLSPPAAPADVFVLDVASGALERWTESETGGIPRSAFIEPESISIRAADGLQIPAFLYRPAGDGPFPVILWMHGGPEEQFRPVFDPIVQYFAAARGIAVLAPNVRGSDGYGKRYLSLDDGNRRHEAVGDVGAVLDYVRDRADLDERRVAIHGASYGGFMVLASLAKYPDRFRAGSDVMGMSNLVTFLEGTGKYRRNLRRAEYGDERDPEHRKYLTEISPSTHIDRIQSALLVAHGENDPRVPVTEARAIVRALRERGRDVWAFWAPGEGHAFRKRRTRDTFYRVLAQFLEDHLLEDPKPKQAPQPNEEPAPVPPEAPEPPAAKG